MMTLLVTNVPVPVTVGRYQLLAAVNTGTLQLQAQTEGVGFVNIDNAFWSADTHTILDLGDCEVRAIFTDASVSLTEMS